MRSYRQSTFAIHYQVNRQISWQKTQGHECQTVRSWNWKWTIKTSRAWKAQRIEDLEVYSRIDQLIVRGLHENSYAERASLSASADNAAQTHETVQAIEKTLINFCRDKLNVTVTPLDISNIHRLKSGPNNPVWPVIVRFANKKICNEIYSAKKWLKGSPDRIFVSEHLTKNASNLFYEARKLKKEKKIFSCWMMNGVVYVEFSPDPTARLALIRKEWSSSSSLTAQELFNITLSYPEYIY